MCPRGRGKSQCALTATSSEPSKFLLFFFSLAWAFATQTLTLNYFAGQDRQIKGGRECTMNRNIFMHDFCTYLCTHCNFLAPEALGHGEGVHQGDTMEEWVCRVLTRMTRSGRQYVWAQAQWNLVLDTWPYEGCCNTMAQCQSCAMMLQCQNHITMP